MEADMNASSETIVSNLKVAARSPPYFKEKIVDDLIEANKIVAFVGDGTNDAPALEKAHAGIVMMLSATDTAKKAGDVLLLDDNFCSILSAILHGRNFVDNVLKFLQFHITFIMVTCLFVFIGVGIAGDETLSAMQLLWIGFIVDFSFPLAFADLKPFPSALHSSPKSSVPVSAEMWRNIIGQALY